MNVTILYFARLREAVGIDREQLALPAGVDRVAELRRFLAARGEPWRAAFTDTRPVRAADDLVLAGDDAALRDGAEVAFFPPVTGG